MRKILLVTSLFLSIFTVIPSQAQESNEVNTSPTTTNITISGNANSDLLNQFTTILKEKEEKSFVEVETDSGDPQFIKLNQFKTYLNLPYANTKNPRQQLDIIYPSVGNAPYKVIVNFHGGGWISGSRKSANHSAVMLATQQGYAVINVGYRLATEETWPAQLHDAKAAIRFIRANARKYRLNTNNIVVWGNSAGGHIASMLAATNGMKDMEDLTLGYEKYSSDVQGVVSFYGISDVTHLRNEGVNYANALLGFNVQENPDKARLASPIEYVSENFPPIFIIHGTNDQVVPFEQSVKFAEKINAVTGKNQAHLKLLIKGKHGDKNIKSVENVDESLNFVDKIMYPERKNPYRTKRYKEIKTTTEVE
ncbi:alpha/beta hydrolase [Ureibacillus xyleni]|uniref:alpha/beta hydrolase n=1 Tax=Ureibacillus xyleni TaxID=614648 RepID=UPI0013793CFF|nr:alpha/beta hydrolase [Ureibacillus xyleni]